MPTKSRDKHTSNYEGNVPVWVNLHGIGGPFELHVEHFSRKYMMSHSRTLNILMGQIWSQSDTDCLHFYELCRKICVKLYAIYFNSHVSISCL